jgi:hypothetical protein
MCSQWKCELILMWRLVHLLWFGYDSDFITEALTVATATASLPNSSRLLRLQSWYFEGKSAIARSSGCTLHWKETCLKTCCVYICFYLFIFLYKKKLINFQSVIMRFARKFNRVWWTIPLATISILNKPQQTASAQWVIQGMYNICNYIISIDIICT